MINMSNGYTSAFIEITCLVGSHSAHEPHEKDLMVWFAQRDQHIFGAGAVGFDIVEIVWDKNLFERQKTFILQVTDLIIAKKNWENMECAPDSQTLKNFRAFYQMIAQFKSENVDESLEIPIASFDGTIKLYDTCGIHKVYKHFRGCVVCNAALPY